jgi:hypothetical protein
LAVQALLQVKLARPLPALLVLKARLLALLASVAPLASEDLPALVVPLVLVLVVQALLVLVAPRASAAPPVAALASVAQVPSLPPL